jgi:hypothetical protein
MKTKLFTTGILSFLTIILISLAYRCSGTRNSPDSGPVEIIRTNVNDTGVSITVDFKKGQSHNHPLMAIWIEDTNGRYIETLYIAESIGRGIFQHADKSKGEWVEGPARRPAALPYWGHKRGIQAEDGYFIPTVDKPMPDAVTGPTPAGSFLLQSKTTDQVPAVFNVLLEINQSWDWNEYWTNSKYPEDINYKTSSQPSLVYKATIDVNSSKKEFKMQVAGHGHYSGLDGSLDADLSTITTALDIAGSITVKID